MFCKYCGSKLLDNAVFCHACGKATNEHAEQTPVTPVPPVQPVYQQPVSQPPVPPVQNVYQPPVQPVYQPPVQPVYQQPVRPYQPPVQPAPDPIEVEKLQKQALTCGILGLALSMLGVPGIIFSAIGGSKASEFKKLTGQLTGRARTGYGLAKAGKIVSIVMTVLLTLLLPSLLSELIYAFENPFEYFSF